MANNTKRKKVIKVALFGSLVGGVMGLLLAPKSGQELRQDISGQSTKLGDKAGEFRDKALVAWQNVEDKAESTVNTGKSWVEKGKLMFNNFKTMVSEIRQGALTKTSSIAATEAKEAIEVIEITETFETIEATEDKDSEDLRQDI